MAEWQQAIIWKILRTLKFKASSLLQNLLKCNCKKSILKQHFVLYGIRILYLQPVGNFPSKHCTAPICVDACDLLQFTYFRSLIAFLKFINTYDTSGFKHFGACGKRDITFYFFAALYN
jgi:hypothetical protein